MQHLASLRAMVCLNHCLHTPLQNRCWIKHSCERPLTLPPWKEFTAEFEAWPSKQDFRQAITEEEEQREKRYDAAVHQIENLRINGWTVLTLLASAHGKFIHCRQKILNLWMLCSKS